VALMLALECAELFVEYAEFTIEQSQVALLTFDELSELLGSFRSGFLLLSKLLDHLLPLLNAALER
jgi:hypothetical protein